MVTRSKRRMPSSKRSAPIINRFRKFGNSTNLKLKTKKVLKRTGVIIDKKPLTSFFVLLAAIFVLIIVGSFLRQPKKEAEVKPPIKEVSAYSIGSAPTIKVQAQIEKSGVIKVVALTPGVVSQVNVSEGQEVSKGELLVALSTNYQGGNAAGVQREIAQTTNQNVKDTYDIQKEVIKKQREIADKTDANADQLRDITQKSVDESKSLLNLNQEIVDSLDSTLQGLESSNQNGANDAQILQTKQLISQFQSAVNQLQSAVRSTEFQAAGDKPPADLSNLSREITQKQLDIQEKALTLSLETSRLQLQLAQIQEATMYPAAPFAGVVEKVYVTQGESVNPGTPIALIHGAQTLKAVARVPRDIAQKMSEVDLSTISIGNKIYKTAPSYISKEATDGSLYSIFFSIPVEFQNNLADNEFVTAQIPVGLPDTSGAIPFVPLDAIYQSTAGSYLFIIKEGKALTKKISLGSIVGEYAQVVGGLSSGDEIILTRSVVNGDPVRKINGQ
jgi:RND family efflux transporter MFP subunit